jgi:hypothetical protein
MTKAEAEAHMDTLQDAKTAALKAYDRVFQDSGMDELRLGRYAIESNFDIAIKLVAGVPTED